MVADFQVWWINVIYIVGVLAVGLAHQPRLLERHPDARHEPTTRRATRPSAPSGTALAVAITLGFLAVPVGVMTGLVR